MSLNVLNLFPSILIDTFVFKKLFSFTKILTTASSLDFWSLVLPPSFGALFHMSPESSS